MRYPLRTLRGLLCILLPLSSTACRRASSWDSGEALLAAMHGAYAETWYRTLSFKQTVTLTDSDGTVQPTQVWTEYARIPSTLRIDRTDGYDGDGVIYAGDSLFVFEDGALVRRQAGTNDLLTLGFDVYAQAPERTAEVLRAKGFDLSKIRRDTWRDRAVWVVGADSADLHTRQFWVDAERLVFVRLLEPAPQDSARTREFVFDDYRPLGGGWIAPLVLFLLDGREYMREEYYDVVADPVLPEGTFDPERWGPVH